MSKVVDSTQVRNSTVGSELTEGESRLLAEKMGVRALHDGEVLVTEGDADQTLFVLAEGRVDFMSKDSSGVSHAPYSMKIGECAGTRAFVEQTPRRGTLVAVGETTVYTLNPTNFETLLVAHPLVAYKVMKALFRETHANLSRKNRESEELANYINKTQGRY